MVTTSCGTRRARSSTTSISTSTIDRAAGPSLTEGPARVLVRPPHGGLLLLLTERFDGSCTTIVVYWNWHRRGLCAGRARFRADLPRHQCGEFRARRILHGGGLSDGGIRRRSRLAILAVVPAGAGRHGAIRRDLQSRGLLSLAPPHLPPRDHRDHRRLDPAFQFRAGDLWPAAAGAGGMVRNPRHSAWAGLSRQPVSPDHRGDDDPGRVQLLVLRAHHARQEAAGDFAGQGDG